MAKGKQPPRKPPGKGAGKGSGKGGKSAKPRRNAKGQGRKPKPTAVKKAEGNPGRRKLNEREPDFGPAEENVIAGPWKGTGEAKATGGGKSGGKAAGEARATGAKPTVPVPGDLDGNEVAMREWCRLFPRLSERKVVQATDVNTLVMACLAYADAMEARAMIATRGIVAEEPIVGKRDGETEIVGYRWKRAPWAIQFKESAALYRAYASELGLTPSSRSVLFGSDPADDSVDAYLDNLS